MTIVLEDAVKGRTKSYLTKLCYKFCWILSRSNTVSNYILLPNTAMTFCRCQQRFQAPPSDDHQLDHLDLLTASRYLRKVGLKVQDVSMKLGINRIIHFLTNQATKTPPQGTYLNELYQFQKEKRMPSTAAKHSENKQNLTDMNEPQSFVNIATSRSLLSSISVDPDQNPPFTPSPLKAFNFKQVVTKNSLEEQPAKHVRFVSSVRSQAEEQEKDQMFERLENENRNLQKCLKNIFHFFQENNLISLGSSAQPMQSGRYGEIVEQLTTNFIDYTQEIKQKIANLSAKSSLLQGTLHNMSTSMRIDKEKEDPTTNTAVQTEEKEDQSVQELKAELAAVIEASKRTELVLYLRQEETAQLKIMISGLQNKLKHQQEGQSKPRSKSYKKYFQITGQDLSKSVR